MSLTNLVMNQPEGWIDTFFASMATVFLGTWTTFFPTEVAIQKGKEAWFSELGHYDIDIVTLAFRLMLCERPTFPPNLMQFLTFCDTASGIPSFEEAFILAVMRNFKSEVVKLAYDHIGYQNFRMLPEKTLRERFKISYKLAISTFNQNKRKEILMMVNGPQDRLDLQNIKSRQRDLKGVSRDVKGMGI